MQNNRKNLKSSKTKVDIVSNTTVNASTTDNTANATPIIASTNKIHINYNSKNNNNNNNSNNNNNNNNNNTVQQTFKCYVHGSLIYTRKNVDHILKWQSSVRQYFEILHVWKSKFWKKQLPPEFSMEMF